MGNSAVTGDLGVDAKKGNARLFIVKRFVARKLLWPESCEGSGGMQMTFKEQTFLDCISNKNRFYCKSRKRNWQKFDKIRLKIYFAHEAEVRALEIAFDKNIVRIYSFPMHE